VGEGVSFSQPLAAPLAVGHAVYNALGKTSVNCGGLGQAAPGFLCLYAARQEKLSLEELVGAAEPPGRYGFAVFFFVEAEFGLVDGSWTVTAP